MSERNVARVTEVVRELAKELGVTGDINIDRLARQLAVDMRVTPSRQPGAKMTPAKVRNIRKLAAEGVKQKDIAEKYGMSAPAINLIIHRKTWADLAD